MPRELFVFEIDEGAFAVPTSNVREVLRAAALFPLPEYPSLIEGGLNLRGEVVPVVDGRAILSRERKPIDPSDHMIVLQDQSRYIAIHVSRAIALTVVDDDVSEKSEGGKFISRVITCDQRPTSVISVGELIAACQQTTSPSPTGVES